MKTLRSLVLLAAGIYCAAQPVARADIVVDTSISFNSLTISGASVTWQGASAYGQAGGNESYSSSGTPTIATDVPVPGSSMVTGGGSATASTPAAGSAYANGQITGAAAGYDTSCGQASVYGIMVNNLASAVDVNFSVVVSDNMLLQADSYGLYGQGEDIFALTVNGTSLLFSDQLLTIGPNQSLTDDMTTTLTATMVLAANTTDYLYAQADSEAMVVNSSTPTIPEPSQGSALGAFMALALLLGSFVRRAWRVGVIRRLILLAGVAAGLALPALPARATYIGSDPPDVCQKCGFPATRQQLGGIGTSLTEGNMQETYSLTTIKSAYGPTLPFDLTYNSYNADGSKAQLNIGLGFGWSDTYNTLLFQQLGQMFELGADGRVTRFYQNYSSPGLPSYTSGTGYFETMAKQPDGSYIATNKFQSWWRFGLVPNTPFLIEGPVYRLLQMGDRNGNVTTFTYNSGGLLTNATDTYGRTLQFSYNSSNELSTVMDPLGRTTRFSYDSLNRELTQITDPMGRTTTYSYNSQYQMTQKTDRDGRQYFYMYRDLRPYAVADSSGQPWFSLSNPNNWATDPTQLAQNQLRVYTPGTTTSTDGRGKSWQYQYDSNGYLTQMADPDGSITTYTYDPNTYQMSSLTDANGNVTRYQYDANGNRTNMTDALGYVTTYTYDPVFNQITSMTDPQGRTTQYQYDSRGNLIEEIDPLGQSNLWTYDSHGNVLTSTDKRGNTTVYTYDPYGNLLTKMDPMDNTTLYSYDSIGNLISTTDPNGNTTRYQYDTLDRLIGETNALGGVTTYTYDAVGRQVSTTDPNTNTTTYTYDLRGRLVQTTNALGYANQYGYDANDNRLADTNQLGHVTIYTYDALNRMVDTTNALGNVTRYTYDPVGNRISTTDPNTNTTYTAYDALNRVVEVTNALGRVTIYDYSTPSGMPCCGPTPGSSLITRMQDPDGNVTYYHYDELNRQVQTVRKNSDTNDVINPGDAVTTTAYDADNNIVARTDPNTNTTQYFYDTDNRRVRMVDPLGYTTQTTYDGDGNVLTITEPNLNVITNTYDALNRVITTYDQIGRVQTLTYDADGNVLSVADGLSHTTFYDYDGLNRRIEMIDPLGQTTTTFYDADDNVTSITDRNGHTTTYTYDALDRRISTTDALGNTTKTAYDADDNVISLMDANGHTTTYTYDGLNRRITETYPDTPPNTETYMYDAVGNLIERVDPKGQVTTYTYNDLYFLTNRAYLPSGANDSFIYDLGGRMLMGNRDGWADTFAYDGADHLTNTVQNGRVLTYTYNIPGRVQTNTQPSGRVLVYTYDARNRLATLQDQTLNPPIVTYTYDDADRVVGRAYRNGTTATYYYDADDRVISLVHSNATTLITGFDYAYDNEGNKLYEQKLDNPGDSEVYQYDALDRLTNYDTGALSGQTIPSPIIAKLWFLDPLGNWSTIISNGVPEVRTHGPANELLTDNGSNFLYDADGNLIQDNNYQYRYDEENRLTQIQRLADSAMVGQYFYDALGRRVTSITDPAGTAATNDYFYDGNRIIEEQNPAGLTMARYTYGNYVDEMLTMDRSGQTYYYHPNALWSVQALSDASGYPVERYTYDAYGYVTVLGANYAPLPPNYWGTPQSAVGNRFLFTGQEFGEEAGLYHYRARFYDALKGRFLQRDPLDYTNSLNLYEYVNDRPTYATDPTGLAPSPIATPSTWQKKKAKFSSTVRIKQCCFNITVDLEYESRLVTRSGKVYEQWRNLTYPTAHLGERVNCTGKEVGELWNPSQWRVWSPPWAPEGEEPANGVAIAPNDQTLPPSSDAFTQAPPGGTEFGPSADPQMLGD